MIKIPAHLSYSALTTFVECGERYRLERHKLQDSDWFASAGGGAVHTITEHYDTGDVPRAEAVEPRTFRNIFDKEIAELEERGKILKPSGKVVKTGLRFSGGPNKRDAEWWYLFGPQIVQAYIAWREYNPWSLAQISGAPAVEVPFDITIAGVQLIGYIDRIFYDHVTQQYIIVDIKTGAAPKSDLQLGTYQLAMRVLYGWDIPIAGYLSPYTQKEYAEVIGPRGGKKKELVGEEVRMGIPELKTPSYDQEQIEKHFRDARNQIERGEFLANPGSACNACPVIDYCWVKGGHLAQEVPIQEEVVVRQTEADEQRDDEREEDEDGES